MLTNEKPKNRLLATKNSRVTPAAFGWASAARQLHYRAIASDRRQRYRHLESHQPPLPSGGSLLRTRSALR